MLEEEEKRKGRKGAVDIIYFKKYETPNKKRKSVFRFKVKTRNRKGIVWVYNIYSDINDVNKIL
jgi:hypothetical protein